jgi:hypothetical protein
MFTTKQMDFKTPHSKQTPTKPSPQKVKIREEVTLDHIERIPPLLPTDGRNAQLQSWEPHRLKHNCSDIVSLFVS